MSLSHHTSRASFSSYPRLLRTIVGRALFPTAVVLSTVTRLFFALLVIVAVLSAEPQASAGGGTTSCATAGDVTEVTPDLACIATIGTTTYAVLGYTSTASGTILAPPGTQNYLSGEGTVVPPSMFLPGHHASDVVVPIAAGASWHLGTETLSLAPSSGLLQVCSTTLNAASGDTELVAPDGTVLPLSADPALYAENAIVPAEVGSDQNTAGFLEGKFAVTNDGAATYTLPIEVPPGRAGMQPHLALSYNSRSTDTLAGYGWSLAGLSSIERCPSSVASRGAAAGVQFDDTDALCLDGSHLVSNAALGTGVEYRRERDAYDRIVADENGDAAGPFGFTVYTRDGLLYHYGITGPNDGSFATIEGQRTVIALPVDIAQGGVDSWAAGGDAVNNTTYSTGRYAWLLSSVQDRFGNAIKYSYAQYNGQVTVPGYPIEKSGVQRVPSQITYTHGSGGAQATKLVQFTYHAAAYPKARFVNGLELDSAVTLGEITVQGPMPSAASIKTIRTYQLTTVLVPQRNRERFEEVKICDGANTCQAPLQFSYQDDLAPASVESGILPYTDYPQNINDAAFFDAIDNASTGNVLPFGTLWSINAIDVNNDGKDDLVYRDGVRRSFSCGSFGAFTCYTYLSEWWIRLSTGTGFGPAMPAGLPSQSTTGSGPGSLSMASPRFIDFDGDGLPEAIAPSDGPGTSWSIYKIVPNSGQPVFSPIATLPSFSAIPSWTSSQNYAGDMDGDGLPELIRPYQTSQDCNGGICRPAWALAFDFSATSNFVAPAFGYQASGATIPDYLQPTPNVGSFFGNVDGSGRQMLMTWGSHLITKTDDYPWPRIDGNHMTAVGASYGSTASPSLDFHGLSAGLDWNVYIGDSGGIAPLIAPLDLNGDGLTDLLNIVPQIYGTDPLPIIGVDQAQSWWGQFGTTALNNGSNFVQYTAAHTFRLNATGGMGSFRMADVDLDGIADVIDAAGMYTTGAAGAFTPKAFDFTQVQLTAHAFGNTSVYPIPTGTAVGSKFNYPGALTLDINGDGLTDFMQVVGNETNWQVHVYTRDGSPTDVLTTVTSAGGQRVRSIVYQPASMEPTDATFHIAGCAYPISCKPRGMWVVARDTLTYSSPWLSTVSRPTTHTFTGPRTDVAGRGWLGFDTVTSVDIAASTTTTTNYGVNTERETTDITFGSPASYLYPFAGMWTSRTTTVSNLLTTVESASPQVEPVTAGAPSTAFNVGVASTQAISTSVNTVNGTTVEVANKRTSYTYDGFGNVTDQKVVRNEFSGLGTTLTDETITTYAPANTALWLVASPTLRTVTSTDDSGRVVTRTTSFATDPATGAVNTVIREPSGNADTYLRIHVARNVYGQVLTTTHTDSLGDVRTETISYDALDSTFPWRQTDAVGHVTYDVYHPSLGVPVLSRDPNGVASVATYDTFGRLRSVQRPEAEPLAYSYQESSAGSTNVVVAGPATHGEVDLDAQGRPWAAKHLAFDGVSTVETFWTYDDARTGKVASVTVPSTTASVPAGVANTTYTYDALGRAVVVTAPNGGATVSTYQPLQVSVSDPRGHVRVTAIDEAGRAKSIVEEGDSSDPGSIRTFTYGPFDELWDTIDVNGNVTSSRYDTLGRQISLADPDTGTTQAFYSAFDAVRDTLAADGSTLHFNRDGLDRAVSIVSSQDGTACYQWDAAPNGIGSLAATQSPDGVGTSTTYDTSGAVISQTWTYGGTTYTLGSSYDAYGRLQTVTYPSPALSVPGPVVTYGYASNGELSTVTSPPAAWPAFSFTVQSEDAAGKITQEETSTSLLTQRTYDVDERLTDFRIGSRGQAIAYEQQLTYDLDGLPLTRTEVVPPPGRTTSIVESFNHDPLHRLHTWTADGLTTTYTYDALGNLTERNAPDGNVTWKVAENGAGPHAVTSSSQGDVFGYSAVGNRTTSASAGESLTYTSFGLPKTVQLPSTSAVSSVNFLYDAFGARSVQQQLASAGSPTAGRTTYTFGPIEVRFAFEDETTIFHVPGPGGEVGQLTYDVQQLSLTSHTVTGDISYLHRDGFGTPVVVSDKTGAFRDRQRFDPFGRRMSTTVPSTPAPRTVAPEWNGFTGQDEDDLLGFVNMNGRIYDPKTARFLTPDPLVSAPHLTQAWNRYSYVMNSPLGAIDPSGYAVDDMTNSSIDFSASSLENNAPCVQCEFTVDAEDPSVELSVSQNQYIPCLAGLSNYQRDPTDSGDDASRTGNNAQVDGPPDPRLGAGVLYGTTQALTPGGFVAPSPSDDREFSAGKAIGQLATGLTEAAVGGLGAVGGGALVVGSPIGGPAAPAVAVGGVAIVTASAAVAANGTINVTVAAGDLYSLATGSSGSGYNKPFTKWNFRANLVKRTGIDPKGMQAHHVFPQSMADKFQKIGIDVHDPNFGAWFDETQHLKTASAYNAAWDRYFNNGTPDVSSAKALARILAAQYGYSINF